MTQIRRAMRLKWIGGGQCKSAVNPSLPPFRLGGECAAMRTLQLAPWKKVSYDHEAAVKAQRGGYALKSKG